VLWQLGFVWIDGAYIQPDWLEPFAFLLVPLGIALFFGTLHLARGIGRLHGTLAKHMLVRG
jgi:hypothetical protein